MKKILFYFLLLANSIFSQTCEDAKQVSVPFDFIMSTCGLENKYLGTNGCEQITPGTNPYRGEDVWFKFQVQEPGLLSLSLPFYASQSIAIPKIYIFDACPLTSGRCIRVLTNSQNGVLELYPGKEYYIILDAQLVNSFPVDLCYDFRIVASFTRFIVNQDCYNIGFEQYNRPDNFNTWIGTTGVIREGAFQAATPQYNMSGIGFVSGRHTIVTSGIDPCGNFPRVDPLGGVASLKLGNEVQPFSDGQSIYRSFLVTPQNSNLTYRYSVVFNDPSHNSNVQPFFQAVVKDNFGNKIDCSEFSVTAGAGLEGFLTSTSCLNSSASVIYKPWSSVNVDLSDYIGEVVTLQFTVGDCGFGGHYAYAYVDAKCEPSIVEQLSDTICLGESITKTAPSGYKKYFWVQQNSNSVSITLSPQQTQIYTLELTSFNGCKSKINFEIVVSERPIAPIIFKN